MSITEVQLDFMPIGGMVAMGDGTVFRKHWGDEDELEALWTQVVEAGETVYLTGLSGAKLSELIAQVELESSYARQIPITLGELVQLRDSLRAENGAWPGGIRERRVEKLINERIGL